MDKKSAVVAILCLSLIFSYVILRAIYVPLTIDEAITYFSFVVQDSWLPTENTTNANNHILNTGLTIISERYFGNSELALRLPNVIGFICYAIYAFLWSKWKEQDGISFSILIGLTSSHFLLELFGLCRGYGLSMAFLLGSWYHLYNWWCKHSLSQLIAFLILSNLAVLANLALLVPIIVSFVIALCSNMSNTNSRRKTGLLASMLALLPLTVLISYALRLKEGGHLYYGSDTGFWSTTIESLVSLIFRPWDSFTFIVPAATCILMVFGVYRWLRSSTLFWKNPLPVLVLLVFGSATGLVLLNIVFGVNYPEDRVGLYFLPLFVLAVGVSFQSNTDRIWGMLLKIPLALIWLLPLNSIATMNLGYTRLWKWNSNAKSFYTNVVELKGGSYAEPIIAGGTLDSYTYDYYNLRNNCAVHSMQDHISNFDIADLQYGFEEGSLNKEEYDTISHHISSNRFLLANKSARIHTTFKKSESKWVDTKDEYLGIVELLIDTLAAEDLIFEYEVTVSCSSPPLRAWIVLDITDKEGRGVYYLKHQLEHFGKSINNLGTLENSFVLPKNPSSFSAKLYIWNIEHASIQVEAKSKVSLLLD